MKPVRDMSFGKKASADDIVRQMKDSGGFVAKELGTAVDILEKMIEDKQCTRFLSFTANIISTGTRGIIKDMIKEKYFDAVITTCGTLDHDLARLWKDYHHGSFDADDKELVKEHIHRLGNVFIPIDSYGVILEKKLQPMFKEIVKHKKEFSSSEIIREVGKKLEKEKKKKESIIYWAYKNDIPIFVPGITDGAFGLQLWMYSQRNDLKLNLLKDESEISNLVFDAKKTGALIVGGGISKHHTIWWSQFNSLSYAVYVTTAYEYDGSLSGARVKEAISWKKVARNSLHKDVICDATVALPLMYAALKERL